MLIPAETPWLNGVPLLSKMGTEWKLLHAYLGACAVCGFELEPGRRVYRLHSCKDAQNIRKAERQHSHDLRGPGHRSCMAFAAFACPYFHGPLSKLGKDSNIDPGVREARRRLSSASSGAR